MLQIDSRRSAAYLRTKGNIRVIYFLCRKKKQFVRLNGNLENAPHPKLILCFVYFAFSEGVRQRKTLNTDRKVAKNSTRNSIQASVFTKAAYSLSISAVNTRQNNHSKILHV